MRSRTIPGRRKGVSGMPAVTIVTRALRLMSPCRKLGGQFADSEHSAVQRNVLPKSGLRASDSVDTQGR